MIALFGAVLALSSVGASSVGAAAPQLEHALHIGNTKVGLLSSVALLVGAVFVIPVGLLVDRFRRIPMLSASILLWTAASALSAFASSYDVLLLTRLALGAVTATAGPAIASLTGDYFPARDRGRVYSYILGGELAGSATGFIATGVIASAVSWRVAFGLLALPGLYLARALWRTIPEPARGRQSSLEPGPAGGGLAQRVARSRGVEPDPRLVLSEDPDHLSLPRAIRYTLRVPTNRNLIAGSALGYFYLAGLQTFAVLFVRGHYHTSQATAELVLALLVLGAVVGTLVGGRVTDMLLARGVLGARVYVPAICYIGAVALLIPGLVSSSLPPAIGFDVAGAAILAASNPGLDAARLDIMPARLWGRAESARSFLRSFAQALAPIAFGGVSDLIAGITPAQVPGTHATVISPSAARGLEIAFLIMLASLVAASGFLVRARRTYGRDVATAAASQAAQSRSPEGLDQAAAASPLARRSGPAG